MIVKYTEQEEQQLKKLGRVAGAKLDRLNQIIRESTKDSEEYKNAIKEATELDYELFKARAAIYNQAEQREFSKVSSSVKSIVQNAKEQTEAIIDDIYQAMFYMLNGMQDTLERVENHLKAGDASKEGEGFLLDSAWTIERIRPHLHLHFDALKNHDAAIK
jgi:Mg2+ and Co2+ transporter CorA